MWVFLFLFGGIVVRRSGRRAGILVREGRVIVRVLVVMIMAMFVVMAVFVVMVVFVVMIVFVVMLFMFGPRHPRVYDEHVPLDRSRLLLALFAGLDREAEPGQRAGHRDVVSEGKRGMER